MTLLCASPRCRIPGRHTDACATETTCRGCAPARAADGLQLCPRCTSGIGRDAQRAAALDPDLALALIGQAEPGSRGDHGGISLADAAVEARTLIRAVLSSWCRLIAEERGIRLPGVWTYDRLPTGVHGPLRPVWRVNDSLPGMAAYIATHATWLAAHPAAAEAADEMANLASRAFGAAYPSGTRIIPIGACPAVDHDQMPCVGQIRALLRQEASMLPSAVACDTDDTHEWTADQWRLLGRQMSQRAPA